MFGSANRPNRSSYETNLPRFNRWPPEIIPAPKG